MANADGHIRIDTRVDTRGAQNGISSLTKSLKGFAAAVVAAFSIVAILRFGKACIDTASDLAEVQNVINVTFGSAQDQINEFAKSAAEAFGLSELAAKKYTGTLGAMFKSMGFTTDAAAGMSVEMTGLAGDMASFYNLSSDEAFEKLRSGISGETEPLKQLGINLSQANLEAYALANGFGASYSALSEQQKALVRYNYILSATADAQGDFARTSDSWANQVRILQLQFESLKATLGGAFIAVLTPVLQIINRVLSALNAAATVFAKFIAAVTGRSQELTTASTSAADATAAAADATDALTDSTEASGKAAEAAGKKAKKGLANFDELNVLSAGNDSGSGGAGNGIGGGVADAAIETSQVAGESLIPDEDKLNKFFKKYQTQIDQVKASWGELKDTVSGIWDGMNQQVADTDIIGAAFKTLLSFVYAVLEGVNLVIGSVGDLFLAFNIPATVESGLLLLSDAFNAIGDSIDAISSGVRAFVDKALVPLASWIGDKLRKEMGVFGEILGKIGDWFQKHKEDFAAFGEQLGGLVAAIWELIEPLATGVWTVFIEGTKLAVDVMLLFCDWCIFAQQTLVEFATNAINFVPELWNTIKTKTTEIWNEIKEFMETTVSAIKTAIEEAWNEIQTKTSEIWNGISTFIDGVLNGIGKFFTDTWAGIKNDWIGVKEWFEDNVTGPLKTTFDKLKTEIGAIWDNIWTKIKNVINSITGGIERFINNAINGINSLANGLNELLSSGDAVAEFFGFDGGLRVPTLNTVQLPRLAQGAVIPPNREFAAILGDQRSGVNIETPLATMLDAFKQAIAEMGGVGGSGEIVINLTTNLDGKAVARNQVRYLPKEYKRVGKQAVKVGGTA